MLCRILPIRIKYEIWNRSDCLGFAGATDAGVGLARTWCTGDGQCDNSPGVGPTYVCGDQFWDNYDCDGKRWCTNRDTLSDNFWKTDGFYDCCHASGKGACYDIQNQ
ncbi:hypothetical protein V1507DRAFT_468373 [Lipomyces tetrasporus]